MCLDQFEILMKVACNNIPSNKSWIAADLRGAKILALMAEVNQWQAKSTRMQTHAVAAKW